MPAYANINPASGVPNGVPLPPDLRDYFLNFGDEGAGFWRFLQGPDAGGAYGGRGASMTRGNYLRDISGNPQVPGNGPVANPIIQPNDHLIDPGSVPSSLLRGGTVAPSPKGPYANLTPTEDNSVSNESWNYQGTDPLARFAQNNMDRYYNMWKAQSADQPGLGFYDFLRTSVNPQQEYNMLTPAQQGMFSSVVAPRGRMILR